MYRPKTIVSNTVQYRSNCARVSLDTASASVDIESLMMLRHIFLLSTSPCLRPFKMALQYFSVMKFRRVSPVGNKSHRSQSEYPVSESRLCLESINVWMVSQITSCDDSS